jgi:lysophospholipase L1-like esterase
MLLHGDPEQTPCHVYLPGESSYVNEGTFKSLMTWHRLSMAAIAAFAFGCGTAVDVPFTNPSREPRMFGSSGREIIYVVLGDSTAAGRGAAYNDGIAVGTARYLAANRRVTLFNFGVSGARLRDVAAEQLRVAEQLRPDVVLVSVGANDVTHLTPVRTMQADLIETLRRMRRSNPNVAIVVTGSPDMGAPPRVPALLRPIAFSRTRTVNRMFRVVAAAEHAAFAPIADSTGMLFRKDRSLFAKDRFHPNARGYATWTEVLARSLGDALANQ